MSFEQLLVARWLTGIGSALQNTGAQLFLADISTPANRAQSLGTNQVGLHKSNIQCRSAELHAVPSSLNRCLCVSAAPCSYGHMHRFTTALVSVVRKHLVG